MDLDRDRQPTTGNYNDSLISTRERVHTESESTAHESSPYRQQKLTRYVELFAAKAGINSSSQSKNEGRKLPEGMSRNFQSPTTNNSVASPKKQSDYTPPKEYRSSPIYKERTLGMKSGEERRIAGQVNYGKRSEGSMHHVQQKSYTPPYDTKRTPPVYDGYEEKHTHDGRNVREVMKRNHARNSPSDLNRASPQWKQNIGDLSLVSNVQQNKTVLQTLRHSISPLDSRRTSPMKITDLVDNQDGTLVSLHANDHTSVPERQRWSNLHHSFVLSSPASTNHRSTSPRYVQEVAAASGFNKARPRHLRSQTTPSIKPSSESQDSADSSKQKSLSWQELRKQRLQGRRRRMLPSTPSEVYDKMERGEIDVSALLNSSLEVLGKRKAHQCSPRDYRYNLRQFVEKC